MQFLNLKNFAAFLLFLAALASCGEKQHFSAEFPQNDSDLMSSLNPCNDLIPKEDHHKITAELLKALDNPNIRVYSGATGYIATLVLGRCILYAVFDREGKIVTHYFVNKMHYVKSKVTHMNLLKDSKLTQALLAIANSLRVLPVMPIFIIPDLKCDEHPKFQPLPFLCWNFDESIPL